MEWVSLVHLQLVWLPAECLACEREHRLRVRNVALLMAEGSDNVWYVSGVFLEMEEQDGLAFACWLSRKSRLQVASKFEGF